jgi:hypothetical protein
MAIDWLVSLINQSKEVELPEDADYLRQLVTCYLLWSSEHFNNEFNLSTKEEITKAFNYFLSGGNLALSKELDNCFHFEPSRIGKTPASENKISYGTYCGKVFSPGDRIYRCK